GHEAGSRVDPPDQGGVVGEGRPGLVECRRLAGRGAVFLLEYLLEVEQLPAEVARLAAEVVQPLLVVRREPRPAGQAADPLVEGLAPPEQVGLARPLVGGQGPCGAAGGLVGPGPGRPRFPAAPAPAGPAGPGR